MEVQLLNCSSAALAGSWSLLLHHTPSSSKSAGQEGCGGGIVWASPLGGIAAGAAWSRQCELVLPASPGPAMGHLRVLLCRHGSSSTANSMMLLHAVQLDALHLPQSAEGSGTASSAQQRRQAVAPDAAASGSVELQCARMLLQLPTSVVGLQPAAGSLLQELRQQGLNQTQPQAASRGQQTQHLCPAFSLLQPAVNSQQCADGSSTVIQCTPPIALQAQLLPAVPSAASQQQLFQATAASSDAAALLAAHQALCRRALQLQAGAPAAPNELLLQQQQRMPPWPRVNGSDGFLLPAPAAGPLQAAHPASSAAVDQAVLEQALVQLRQLRGAALRLKQLAAECGEHSPARERQLQREAQQAEAQRLAQAARHAAADIPVLLH